MKFKHYRLQDLRSEITDLRKQMYLEKYGQTKPDEKKLI